MREQKEIICKDGIYYCPVCGSKKITINTSAALNKSEDANTGKYIDILKNKPYRMSNREKAAAYDRASTEGIHDIHRRGVRGKGLFPCTETGPGGTCV